MKYNNKHWSKELDKYKNGTQSESERYQLEKSALDDVFLFEALEGYSNNAVAKKDDSVMPGAAKTGATVFSRRNIAVAASLLVLVGIVGYMQLQFNDNSSDQTIAGIELNEPTVENEENEKVIAMNIPTEEAVEETSQKPAVQNNKNNDPKTIANTSTSSISDLSEQSTKITSSKVVRTQSKEPISKQSNSSQLAIEESTQEIVSTFENETENSPHLEKKNLSKRNGKAKLSLAPSKGDLSTDESASGQSYSLDGGKVTSTNTKVTPPMGWAGFDTYIKTNKRKIATLKSVTVEVTFSVSTDGKIVDVKPNNTSCQACEDEAVRLIKSSGVWKNIRSTTQTVTHKITF